MHICIHTHTHAQVEALKQRASRPLSAREEVQPLALGFHYLEFASGLALCRLIASYTLNPRKKGGTACPGTKLLVLIPCHSDAWTFLTRMHASTPLQLNPN